MPARPAATRPAPRLRRAYFECRWGQLHVHNAIPAGGGFDEATPLLCLHDAGATGRAFAALLPVLGLDRSVYAPDLPGHGESDAPATAPAAVDAAAAAVLDFLDGMRLRQLDLFAAGARGAAVAALLARDRPRALRRIVLLGDPAWPAGLPVAARLDGGLGAEASAGLLRLLG
ncbi:MAG: hypothetical protein RL026_798 [Pseudomonadota bacterium]|jgi:pimeloyl-ACP methyl ester carboxylesterase